MSIDFNFLKDRKKFIFFIAAVSAFLILVLIYWFFFSAPQRGAKEETFSILSSYSYSQVVGQLRSSGFIRSRTAFDFAFRGISRSKKIYSGGYMISKSMNVFEIARILSHSPYLRWVVIPEGLRKEEIAAILQKNLSWSDAQKNEWINVDTNQSPDYFEGVYFPDTYLVPISESPSDIAKRLVAKFEQEFSPYAQQAQKQNMKWTTVLKIASIIQREAAGANDAKLISGIIWNRLLKGMKLDMDSTVQYARGNTGDGWWAPITTADKQLDSPYNTYKYSGLPPHPIDNPGVIAIDAAINPQKTDCLYYLHDHSGQIHCAVDYQQHLKNVQTYLR